MKTLIYIMLVTNGNYSSNAVCSVIRHIFVLHARGKTLVGL